MTTLRPKLLADRVRGSILAVTGAALVLATLVLCVSEYFEALGEREEYAETMARLIAENSKAAIVFADPKGIAEALDPLHEEVSIVSAYIHAPNGTMLGGYPTFRPGSTPLPMHVEPVDGRPRVESNARELMIAMPIREGDQLLAVLHLTVSLTPAYASMAHFSALTGAVLLLAFLMAVPVANRLGRHIVAPVSRLSATMTQLTDAQDFSQRAQKDVDDEVGNLVDRFNGLLTQLQDRDAQLMARQVQLESLVAERTRDLVASNESLRQAVVEVEEARDSAQQASEAKSQFLANMSHEIRSPLNGVIGMTELLRNTPLNDRQAHFCKTIMASSKALLGVLNDVLDLSKIEAGSMEVERIEFDLLDLVEESVQLFAESASRRGIELVCSTNIDRHRRVVGDQVRLRQVLINLLSNAVKFTEAGEVVVDVRDLSEEGQPGHFEFEVRDSGIGMSQDVQARIFDAFVQADGSTSRRYGGTGLGLAISHSIVNLLGGTLQVRSREKQGSVFHFTLPLPLGAQPRPARAFAISGARVLVVDGHPASAQSLQRYLLNWNAQPVHVGNLAAARSRCGQEAQRGGFALLLANYEHLEPVHGDAGGGTPDVAANDQRAREGIAALQEIAETYGTPLVLYSSVSAMARLGDALPAGVRLLAKPLRQSELFNALNDRLQDGDADPAGAQASTDHGLAGARVLLVEDNPVNQEVASEHLRDLGCAVTVANHGAEALTLFKRDPYDIVLMDCQMPVMDGYEATRHMRVWEQEHLPEHAERRTPIVALTANALKGDRDRCLVAGMDDFLPKPFKLSDLQSVLQRWCARVPGRAADTQPAVAAGADTQALIDDAAWAQIQTLASRSEGFLARVLGALADEAGRLDALLAARAPSPGDLAFVAHRVKSAAHSVGATTLGGLLAQIEQHARAAVDAPVGASLRSLAMDELLAAARTALRGTLAELRARSGLALPFDDVQSFDDPQPIREARSLEPAQPLGAATERAHGSLGRDGTGSASHAGAVVRIEPDGLADANPDDAHAGRRVRVLVADDDIVSRSVVSSWLRGDGYEVVEVDDGLAAQTAFAQAGFDLVLLDVLMPNCDGFAACAALRAMPRGRHVPILMLTGLDDTESIHRAYEIGATDFLIKPIAEEILRHRLRYMHRAQAASARLRESEDRLRRAQNTARVSYWEWDPIARRLSVGEGGRLILPLDPEQQTFALEDVLVHIAPEDRGVFEAVAAGADDVPEHSEFRMFDRGGNELLMSQRLERLTDEVTGQVRWLATVQDITERRRAEQRIYRISHFDTITGLPNQNLLRKTMQGLLKLSERHASRLAYLIIDSGEQQLLASSLGHDFNEQFLLELANRLRMQLRGSDLVVPLSEPGSEPQPDDPRAALVHGDRFAAVLNDVGNNDDVTRLCERLIASLSAPIELGDEALFPAINVGIAVFPDDGDDFETLHQHALTALSQRAPDTQTGWHWYQHERDAAARERIALERDLRFAVERAELRVFFQPRVAAHSELPVGMEALVRWNRNGQWVPPARFVPIAEQTGVICQLGEHVLERSVAMLGAWIGRGLPSLRVSVNVSGQQFRESNLPALCAAALDRYRVPGDCLELELTEGILIDASDQVLQQLQALKALGVRLALDDFGTGFSSLAYLSRFPLDVLKIDRSFVDQLADNRQNRVIVRSTLNLAHDLGLSVVAEGVETESQRDWLTDQGCDELQGYLFSKPVPAEEFEHWVLQRTHREPPASITGLITPARRGL